MSHFDIFRRALEAMGVAPKNLDRALLTISEFDDLAVPIRSEDLFRVFAENDANHLVSIVFHQKLASWDYADKPAWADGTGRSTQPRRTLIYDRLSLNEQQRVFCDTRYPYAPALDPPIAITNDKLKGWQPWYTAERQSSRQFYWDAYFSYLRDRKNWEAKNLAALDESSREVIERLNDPESVAAYQSKGLVVGYVQSGKTANFTGVIARAADAGYRLFIVLAGTINILRDQTQRRLDKELVGTEMCGDESYQLDADYAEFVSHGGLPSDRGVFDWERLTGSKDDFKRLRKGISALEFRRYDVNKPFYDPVNLHRERARLLVVKKTPVVLDKLLGDLERVSKKVDLNGIPALLIDDESDQASVNTWKPQQSEKQQKEERKRRTETNLRIVQLLKLLPRAQYVGYTATPFANVFIDPEDAEDLFPADYILSLPRPEGYMGVSEFYDETSGADGDYTSNEKAFVRFVDGPDEDDTNLPQAIDAYVLAGAVKLFREKNGQGKFTFKHHTMLIHNSPRVFVHAEQAKRVEQLLTAAGYIGGGPGLNRLRQLWNADHTKVSRVRAESLPNARSFEDLLPSIGECCRRLDQGKSVLIINGNNKDDAPNFEKAPVWKILVGGTKLSRGYTVEGLTVSYYRRRAGAADTLMQMGRWFGFRRGYQDLVRLYIGKKEPLTKKNTRFINLYEAFRATCQDEEHFREQLKRYSSLKPGERITPKQVPPLVTQHMLPPTSKNKMFNARITFTNFGGDWVEKTVASADDHDVKHNERITRKLLETATLQKSRVATDGMKHGYFEAWTSALSPMDMINFLEKYRWLAGFKGVLTPVLEFLKGTGEHDPQIDTWLFLAPQLRSAGTMKPFEIGKRRFDVRERTRIETGGRYKAFSEPDHRRAAEVFAGVQDGGIRSGTVDLRRHRQAVFLFYPVRSEEEKDRTPTMAFALLFPKNSIKKQIVYTVADSTRSDAVVVPVVE